MDWAIVAAALFQAVIASTRFEHLIAFTLKKIAYELPHSILIFNQENGLRGPLPGVGLRRLRARVGHGNINPGKVDIERCAFARSAIYPDISIALLYHSINRRKSQTCALALFFCCKERFKDTRPCYFVHSNAVIGGREPHIVPGLQAYMVARKV